MEPEVTYQYGGTEVAAFAMIKLIQLYHSYMLLSSYVTSPTPGHSALLRDERMGSSSQLYLLS